MFSLTRTPRVVRPRPVRVRALLMGLLLCLCPATMGALPLRDTPEEAAERFIRSLRSVDWAAAAAVLDPEPLADFRALVTMITEVDESGAFLEYLTGTDSAAYARLGDREVFVRALTALTDDMPGLTHSLYDRDDRIVGGILEGADTAHVVYRTVARISGAVPEVKVMQLRRGPDGWRVLWTAELDVLETALRGARRLSGARRRHGSRRARRRIPHPRTTLPSPRVRSPTACSNRSSTGAGTAHP